MSGIDTWSFTESELSEFMQQVKAVIMHDLARKKLISEETYEDYVIRKFLVIKKPSFFTRLWKRVFTYEGDNNYLVLCTAESLDFRKEGEPEKKPELKVVPLSTNNKNNSE